MRARLRSWLRAGAVVPEVSAACPGSWHISDTAPGNMSASGSCYLSASLSWSRLLSGSWSSGGSSNMAFTGHCGRRGTAWYFSLKSAKAALGVGHWRTSRVLRCRPHSPWPRLWHTSEASGPVFDRRRMKKLSKSLRSSVKGSNRKPQYPVFKTPPQSRPRFATPPWRQFPQGQDKKVLTLKTPSICRPAISACRR